MLDISKPLADLTADLISINSVIGNEKELADEICSVLSENGLEIARLGNSITARLNLNKEKTLALAGHLDTVPKSCENQTIPKIEDGNLIGLGSCDMKSGIACALKILYEIRQKIIEPAKNIVFIFYDGEEGPLPNGITRLLAENKLKNIDFAYILEPTCSKYSVGCLGAITVRIVIEGISAHSANSKAGKNALSKAAQIIKEIEAADSVLSKPRQIDGLSFYETVNVTQLTTQNASNVIPQSANMTINFRFAPDRTMESAKEFIFSLIDKNLIYSMDCANSCYVPSKNIVGFLRDGIEKEIMQAWTDISQLNAAGISAINFGAGDIKVAHKPEEFISLQNLDNFYKLLKLHI